MRGLVRSKGIATLVTFVVMIMLGLPLAHAQAASTSAANFPARGGLDCNGYSKIQKPVRYNICADIKGRDNGRGEDNEHYIGHDEPGVGFFSNARGSGNNLQWQITLPRERPVPATQSFENYIAFWFSIPLCDPRSYPQNPCTPDSDSNIGMNVPEAAGSALLELQLYPPGFSPITKKISCDLVHWCAALNIDSLACNFNYKFCNPDCEEPVNFAFIQLDGVPTVPPGPANQTGATPAPNKKTLLMNQGDTLRITIKDTPAGLLNRIDDLTSKQAGFMIASAQNGFQSLDIKNCAPTSFSFHPEYATAKFGNFVPWSAGQKGINLSFEIGHFTPGRHGDHDADDSPCFNGPTVPGCLDMAKGGDLDFDGSSYKPDWPDGTRNTPTSLQIRSVLGNGVGPVSSEPEQSHYTDVYRSMQFDANVGASEKTCQPTGRGCVVPPIGASRVRAIFYPFFAQSGSGSQCFFTFGNDIRGSTTNDFGRTAQYGTPNLSWFFGDLSGGLRPNPCLPRE